MDYEQDLREVIKQKTLMMNRAAVIGYCTMLEATLERYYKSVWGELLPAEKEQLLSVERTFGKKNPADALTLGRWLAFCYLCIVGIIGRFLNLTANRC